MFLALREKMKPLLVDRLARILMIAAAVLNLLTWASLLARLYPLIASNRVIALHYNVYLKVNDVGSAMWSLLPALIGLAVLLINLFLAHRAYAASRTLALAVLAVTIFYELLACLAGLFIILINIAR